MAKVFISSSHAWVFPAKGEKPLKIEFDFPEWQEELDEGKIQKPTEEELSEFKECIEELKFKDNKIGVVNTDSVKLNVLSFLSADFMKEE